MRLNHAIPSRPALWLALSLCVIALPLLVACSSAAQPESAGPAPAEQTNATTEPSGAQHSNHQPGAATHADAMMIDMAIAARATTLSRDDLRVTQGDTVHLTFTSDEPGEIHLHGYDLTAAVSPDHPGELTFEATTAGAFGINFHVFGEDPLHSEAKTVVSEMPVSVAITAEPDADGGVDVRIVTEGFRFAPESVDQAHAPGSGHAHIYLDGVKLGRVFESKYRIDQLRPGEREIRVTLNTNDHSDLVFDGAKVEATTTINVPDVGQGHGQSDAGSDGHAGHDHDHGDGGEREIVAEVHLGNLEVYP